MAIDQFKNHQPKITDVKVNIEDMRKLLISPIDKKKKRLR